jgi:replicative DNA helicase
MLSAAYEDTTNPHDLLEEAEESLQSIGMEINVGAMTHISSVVKQAIEKIEYYRTLETDITGVPSGFQALDKATRGWQPGDLIILGARPSVGKTAFALNLIKNAAESKLNGKRLGVAVWSLEMKAWSLMMRMISAKSKKNLRALQTGRIGENEMAQVYNFASELGDLDIYFNDDSGVTTQNIKIKARRMKRRGNLGLIVIDYLQLISGTGDKANGSNREQEVSKISRDLKLLAQELEVPIIALSQLSRDVEKRSGPAAVPKPSDLRESGSLEQDADLIMFLFSPSESEIMDDPSLDNVRRVKIAKQRNGHLDTVSLRFEDHLQLFSTIEDNNPELPAGNWRGVTPTLF